MKDGGRLMYTIVVVDDEEELRRAIINRIDWEKIGFTVVGEADNGIEALELIERKEPDLMLTDIRMPFLSGIELARQVREIRPATRIAFLSGYDDFAYAQRAIQYNIISYLLKPITMADLTKELIAIKEKLDGLFQEFKKKQVQYTDITDFIVPLLLDHYQGEHTGEREERLLTEAVSCGLFKNRDNPFQYVVMTSMMKDSAGYNQTAIQHVRSIDRILNKYVKGFSFCSNGKVVSLLIGTRASFDKYLHIIVGDILQSMERILSLRGLIGVSRITEHLSGCHEAYREAVDAMGYSAQTEGGVYYISDEERAVDFDMEHILASVSEVENIIRGGEEEELGAYLDGMFKHLLSDGVSQVQVKFLLVQLFSSVCQIVYAVADGEELKGLKESGLMQKLTFFDGSIQEMKEQFTSFCLNARELISSQRKKSGKIFCDRTLRIIATEYADPGLSLVTVSGKISVSPNYLSTLIKRYEGKTFVDLLTQKRIETAKQLLLCTPMKIREISERCGYSDQHYFSYCFKKYTGLSPNAMRQTRSADHREGDLP